MTLPVEPDILEGLRRLDSATIFNAVCELDGTANLDYTDHTVRCLLPNLGSVIGYAITAEVTTNDANSLVLPWAEFYEYMEGAKGPRIAVLRDIDSRPGRGASLGDGMATLFRRFGVVGAFVEGTVRDLAGIAEVGLPVWAWGTVPGHGTFSLVSIDVGVTVGQLQVTPGDLLFADGDGCTHVPIERAAAVLEAGRTIAERELAIRTRYASPDFHAVDLRHK